MKFLYIILAIAMFLTSCTGAVSYRKELIKDYELLAIDEYNGMSIVGYKDQVRIGIVGAFVFNVGYNNDFIIAKQHPLLPNGKVDIGITYFYIIPIKNKISDFPEENKIGPLSEEQFLRKRKEMGVPTDLNFTIHFND